MYVDGSWRFVDQMLGSQSVNIEDDTDWTVIYSKANTPAENSPQHVQYKLKEEWFLPDPVKLVYTHLCDNAKAQLLARPVTIHEFNQMASLQKGYFNLGLSGLSHPRCVINCPKNGSLSISVGLNSNSCKPYKLYPHLYKSTVDPNKDRLKGHQAKDFCLRYTNGAVFTYHIQFPWIGSYRLDVHGGFEGEAVQWVCQYLIHVQRPCFRSQILSLPVRETCLGVTGAARSIGLVPVQDGKHGIISAKDGNCKLQFRIQGSNDMALRLRPRMKGQHVIRQYYDSSRGNIGIIVKVGNHGNHILFIDVEKNGVRKTIR